MLALLKAVEVIHLSYVVETNSNVSYVVEAVDNRSFAIRPGTSEGTFTVNRDNNDAMESEGISANETQGGISSAFGNDSTSETSMCGQPVSGNNGVQSPSDKTNHTLESVIAGRLTFESFDDVDKQFSWGPLDVHLVVPHKDFRDYMSRVFKYKFILRPKSGSKDPDPYLLRWVKVYMECLQNKLPTEGMNRILEYSRVAWGEKRPAPRMEEVSQALNDYSCTPKNCQRIFICSECHRGIPFLNVFCPNCLEKKKLVWLIKGCGGENCLANSANYQTMKISQSDIKNYKDALCTHSRRTAAYREVYYYSMISIVGNMAKADLLTLLSNTTYEEMVVTAKMCKEEKVMSNILSSNSLSVLKWLEVPVFRYLESCAEVVYADHGNDTSCLDKGLANCAGQQSIERELYSFDEVDRFDKKTLKVLKQRFNEHMNAKNDDSNRVGEVSLESVSEDVQPAGEVPAGSLPVVGDAPPVPEGNPGSNPSKKIRKRGKKKLDPKTAVPQRKSSRKVKPNRNRGYDLGNAVSSDVDEEGKDPKEATPSVNQMDYSERDVNLLLNYKPKKRVSNPDEKVKKSHDELRCEQLLKRLNCSNGETLVAATVIALWLQWKAFSEELQAVELYEVLLRDYLSDLPKEQQAKAAYIASTCRTPDSPIPTEYTTANPTEMNEAVEGNVNASINSKQKIGNNDYHRIQWKHPGVNKPIKEHVLLIDLFVDGVASYAVSKRNTSLFVVNAMINNAPSAERNTKRLSHFLAVVHEAEDVMPVMECIIKDLTITGTNGIYVSINKQWHHIRWGVTGIHGDTVAQEEIAGMKNKKFTINPCIYNESCEATVLSPCEGICVPQRIKAPGATNEMKMHPRTVDRFPVDSPYRYLSLCYRDGLPELGEGLTNQERERSVSSLKSFFTLFKKKLPCWTPPAIPMDSLMIWREERIEKVIQTKGYDFLSRNRNGQPHLMVQMQLAEAFKSDRTPIKCKYDVGLDEYLKVPPNSRYPLDPMHHIPNVGSRILDAISGNFSVKDEAFETFLKQSVDKAMSLKDMLIPPEVGYLAAERIYQLRKKWTNKKRVGVEGNTAPTEEDSLLNRFTMDEFSTKHQTAPPSWLKPQMVTTAGFNKTRSHDDILFLLCYFGWVFQDSMDNPFVFASKQVFDCLGYLYNHVNDYQSAKSVQMILDFFLEFMRSVMPPTFATISIHNATHYLDTIRCFGPLKNHDCFGNERLLQFAKSAAISSPNPAVTVQKRMIQLDDATVLAVGYNACPPSLYLHSQGTVYKNASLKDITICNLTDDKAYFLDDSVPFPTYVDAELGGRKRNHVNKEFTINIDSAKLYKEVTFRGKKCYSATLPEVIDTKWLVEHSDSIGFLKRINGEIAMFVVTGYVVVNVNGQDYPQAICRYLETRSTSSFLSSQHGRVCNQSYRVRDMKELIVSLYQLHMNEAVSLYYKKANVCEYALNSISIRQSNSIKEDALFNRKTAPRYNTRQNGSN